MFYRNGDDIWVVQSPPEWDSSDVSECWAVHCYESKQIKLILSKISFYCCLTQIQVASWAFILSATIFDWNYQQFFSAEQSQVFPKVIKMQILLKIW